MNITVEFERENTTKTVEFTGTTVKEFLSQLNVNEQTVLVVRNNQVITSDISLQEKDFLRLLSVISGG
jgi:sulfur carrier protein ThiS